MNKLKGCGTALATPFGPGTEVDLPTYRKFIEWQVESGIDFVVPAGTTGEGVTLNEEDHQGLVRTAVEAAAGRVAVLAGAGSNCTEQAIKLAKVARAEGADAILAVTPFYNKPSQEGIFRHFAEIAQAVDAPLVFYNVPGRTAINITAETTLRLADVDNIVAIKEASGNLSQIMEIIRHKPSDFLVLSGDDELSLAVTAMGGDGLISVASNLIPGEMARIIALGLAGKLEEARQIHYRYLRLMQLNFVESNPIPVKYALSRMGKLGEVYRLPLCPMSDANKQKMDRELAELQLVNSGD